MSGEAATAPGAGPTTRNTVRASVAVAPAVLADLADLADVTEGRAEGMGGSREVDRLSG
ncbi:hypothetical protein GCM10022244_41110 [Streptomyces gulbargensis]|uniref:FXSXX-COOH protein n=1 Tax=Streptomyces gulbargensis TaxID=364901 RepID=A0ABP7MQ21_9ACTN